MLFGDLVLVGMYSVEGLYAKDNANMPDPVFSCVSQRHQKAKLQDSRSIEAPNLAGSVLSSRGSAYETLLSSNQAVLIATDAHY